MIRFIEKTEKHDYRIAGDDLPTLIDEARLYIDPSKRESLLPRLIRDLEYQSWAEIPRDAGIIGRLCVYYDPRGDLSTYDLERLADIYLIAGYWGVFKPKQYGKDPK